MATNNNLQDLRLGAPPSISISANQYPNAQLSVQTMERCTSLTLHDAADGTRCTREGAMATAVRLIAQLMHERSITENADGLSIGLDWQAMVDAVKYGGSGHPVQMSLTGAEGAAVCWAVEGDATPGVSLSAVGVLTLPAGCTDTLRIKAIRWDDRDARAMVTIPVSGWREVADAIAEIRDLLVQYPSLAFVLAERPALVAVVVECNLTTAQILVDKKELIFANENILLLDGTEDLSVWRGIDSVRTAAIESCDVPLWVDLLSTADNKEFKVKKDFRAKLWLSPYNSQSSTNKPTSAIKVNGAEVLRFQTTSTVVEEKIWTSTQYDLKAGDVLTCGNVASSGWPATAIRIEFISFG